MSDPVVETMIWRALRKRLESFAEVPPILYAGTDQGTPATTHVLVSTINAPPDRKYVANGQPHERRGTLQVMFRHSLVGLNVTATRQQAGALAAHFIDGTKMRDGSVCLTVMEYPEVSDGFEDKGWWNTPVRIRWETEA